MIGLNGNTDTKWVEMKLKNYWSHFGTHKKRTTQNNKLTGGRKQSSDLNGT